MSKLYIKIHSLLYFASSIRISKLYVLLCRCLARNGKKLNLILINLVFLKWCIDRNIVILLSESVKELHAKHLLTYLYLQ